MSNSESAGVFQYARHATVTRNSGSTGIHCLSTEYMWTELSYDIMKDKVDIAPCIHQVKEHKWRSSYIHIHMQPACTYYPEHLKYSWHILSPRYFYKCSSILSLRICLSSLMLFIYFPSEEVKWFTNKSPWLDRDPSPSNVRTNVPSPGFYELN
jgi:hypothetical protein